MAKKATITKAEAVRQAVASGAHTPDAGIAFIKEKFGIDITKPHFSSYKSQIKAKGGKKKARAPRVMSAGASANNSLVAVQDLETVKSLVEKVGAEQVKRIAGLFE